EPAHRAAHQPLFIGEQGVPGDQLLDVHLAPPSPPTSTRRPAMPPRPPVIKFSPDARSAGESEELARRSAHPGARLAGAARLSVPRLLRAGVRAPARRRPRLRDRRTGRAASDLGPAFPAGSPAPHR